MVKKIFHQNISYKCCLKLLFPLHFSQSQLRRELWWKGVTYSHIRMYYLKCNAAWVWWASKLHALMLLKLWGQNWIILQPDMRWQSLEWHPLTKRVSCGYLQDVQRQILCIIQTKLIPVYLILFLSHTKRKGRLGWHGLEAQSHKRRLWRKEKHGGLSGFCSIIITYFISYL